MKDMFSEIFDHVDKWFDDGEKFFEWEPEFEAGAIAFYSARLAYHNYHVWNYEDYGRSDDDALVVMGWRGAQKHNTARNRSINAIDELIRPSFCSVAELHSETLGSIIDRITIQYLKYKNFLANDPGVAMQLRAHIDELIECCQTLLDDIASGRKRCLELPRMKLYFSQEASLG